MWRYVIGLSVMSLVSIKGIEAYMEMRDTSFQEPASTQQNPAYDRVAKLDSNLDDDQPLDYSGRKARIKMDTRGHFVTTAKMNGRRVEVLVDTGATSVVVNKSTAQRLGIHLTAADFKYTVNTANGQTKAAAARIERIEIGRVVVKDVQAAVLQDAALDGSLLGMTFLGQLKSFEIKNRQLLLTQ